MPLLSLRAVSLSYGHPPLLDGIDLEIDPAERVCLIGRNGTGKSTLLKLIDGEIQPDAGALWRADGLRVARLAQEAPLGDAHRVLDVVAEGLGELGTLVAEYHHLSHGLAQAGAAASERDLARLATVQQRLEAGNGWEIEQRAERVISRLGLDGEAVYATLSGGLRRRVMLARALISEPDLLLLDEPTNHLDIETIEWLEELMLGFQGSLLFITHDRRFLRNLATRILELDRGQLTDWPGDYDNYLRRREERLHAEAKERERFDKRLAEEEVWIRQGIKARRTRNEGRVRALQAMREERRARREGLGQARLSVDSGERSGKLVVEAQGVTFAYQPEAGAAPTIQALDTLILRGDRVGIIGPNGAGKSTLLKLLLGQLQPDAGQIRLGTNLKVAYFDQLRAQLDPNRSVRDNVAGGSDKVEVGGRSLHVLSYLKDFLFAPERAQQPVSALSGGERNRLLLAKLFTQPANLLVLDEPTNDLDAETLDLLEELLNAFDGTLLLVSHDRDLLDNVVTSSLVLEGDGWVQEYVGGYSDWQRQRDAKGQAWQSATEPKRKGRDSEAVQASAGRDSAGRDSVGRASTGRGKSPGKLSYKDQRALEQLPQQIEALENEVEQLHARLGDPMLYQGPAENVTETQSRLAEVETALAGCYERWEALEAAQQALGH
ncbi:ribosomal protection-like ABC-F family protein [Halochromatium salexigens]|uniref:ATP-binding protein Uup n=1 Tax=Halochromatium salexigens TaxID=49447 RepID=A0AAJ0UCT2_HALSE|nr:ATP-binding cassette domain-containing protein [Halochromatium salexigens]MBK5929140.1 ABC transporter ATP-binding protein [Halochromatium salexigens]